MGFQHMSPDQRKAAGSKGGRTSVRQQWVKASTMRMLAVRWRGRAWTWPFNSPAWEMCMRCADELEAALLDPAVAGTEESSQADHVR